MKQASMPWRRTILDLCSGTGEWSRPYLEAGYQVIRIEAQQGGDVRLLTACEIPRPVHGILAAPPCTEFASSGARWWQAKGERALLEGLAVVDACLRLVRVYRPSWWALENPVGRLVHYLGEPAYSFDPCDFGDPYTKRTLLWGDFNQPFRKPVDPTMGSLIHKLWSSKKTERSQTPAGFARAFMEANP